MSWNRALELAANGLVGVGNGLSTVLVSALLQLLAGSDWFVGLAEGGPALLAVAAALPAGLYSDRHPTRDAFPKDAGLWLQVRLPRTPAPRTLTPHSRCSPRWPWPCLSSPETFSAASS